MFVTKQVFDPALEGKAVVISGLQVGDKVVLIGEVHDDKICVVDQSGLSMFLKSEDFRQGELSLEILERKPMRTTPGGRPGRQIKGKHMRTEEEIKSDEGLTLSILMEHPNGLVLGQLKNEMFLLGCKRWTNGSASGYLRSMIKKGLPIERVAYGRYRYKGGEI